MPRTSHLITRGDLTIKGVSQSTELDIEVLGVQDIPKNMREMLGGARQVANFKATPAVVLRPRGHPYRENAMNGFQPAAAKTLVLAFASMAWACGGNEAEHDGEPEAAMSAAIITSPTDNQTLEGNVTVRLGTQGIEIRPAGTNEPGTGHHHLFIDRDISPVGEPIPTSDGIVHLGGAQTEHVFENLAPGDHTIIAVLGDHLHVRLSGVSTDTVHVTVAGT